MNSPNRQYRAGQSVEDHCRSCHEDRTHTVIVVDGNAQPLRVACDFCRSEHNYRGGPRLGGGAARTASASARMPAPHNRLRQGYGESAEALRAKAEGGPYGSPANVRTHAPNPLPLISERERLAPPMTHNSDSADLELLIRRIIREETGLTPVTPAEKWRGGEMVLKPGKPGVQEKSWPIDSFFHKVVMLRNRLRTLEQQVNASDLPDDQKIKIQGYITGCYGSLTSFNVLFADDDDRFVGAAGQE
ncbi:MAG: hypothetical protein WC815_13400 [Vicinamibacterales bacterium]|jgi:hypothetical protein